MQSQPFSTSETPDRPAEAQSGRLLGCADRIDRNGVAGWAFNPDRPDIPVELEIVDCSEVIAEIVANRFREGLADAGIGDGRHSFDFTFAVPLSSSVRHEILIRRSSDKQQLRHSEVVLEVADLTSTLPPGRIDFYIDQPALTGRRRAELSGHGNLLIEGWAIADAGLAAVEIYLDGAHLGNATHGLARSGLQKAFPGRPNALRAGFAFSAPRRPEPGQRNVAIIIRDNAGAVRTTEFRLGVLPASREPAGWSPRRHIPLPELTTKQAILRRAEVQVNFLVVLRLEDHSPPALDSTRLTLMTLSRQAFPAWRLGVLRSERNAETTGLLNEFGALAAKLVSLDELEQGEWDLAPATGSHTYILPLRAGDQLGADALLEIALLVSKRPHAEFIYTDERRSDPASGTVAPYFKPDWSPELLLSTNYIGRLWAASANLVRRVAAGPERLLASGEYDAVLRLTEAASEVLHLPIVLCTRGAARLDDDEAEQQALACAAARRASAASVEPGRLPGTYRFKRSVSSDALVSIVMPTAGIDGLFKTAITSLRAQTRCRNFEIVLVENIPADEAPAIQWASANADAVVTMAEPFNWSRFNNIGAAQAKGEYLLFLNDDIEVVAPGWLEALLEHAQQPDVGVVGARLLYPDRTVQHAGMFLSDSGGRHAFRFSSEDAPGPFGLALMQREVIAVTGACMMIRRDVFWELGGFDQGYGVINNDMDFCLRAHQAGLRTVFTPHATLIHHEKASRALLDETNDIDRLSDKWALRLRLGDPFFNPNLSKSYDDYVPEPEPVELVYPARPYAPRETIRRILVIKLDEIGDFITALPALRRLKQHFPTAELSVLAPSGREGLARLEPTIDRMIPWPDLDRAALSPHPAPNVDALAKLAAELRRFGFDLAIDMRRQPETRSLLQHSGAQWLAGFDRGGQFPWLDIVANWAGDASRTGKQKHVSDDLLSLVEAVTVAFEALPSPPTLTIDEARRVLLLRSGTAEKLIGWEGERIAGIHAGAGAENRRWPAARFAALIDLLAEEEGIRSVIVGGAEDRHIADLICSQVARPETVRSLVGCTGIDDLPVLVQACDLFIGNNSGPQHLAAAFGVPTVCVHSGVIDTREWGPLGPRAVSLRRQMICSPCYLAEKSECHRDLACLQQLSPGEVLHACRELLSAWQFGVRA